ncbi:DJ-1/PfpI family protein [Robertmurraya sp. Marseille-Q9965]
MKKYAMIVYDNCAIWQVTLLQKFLKDQKWDIHTFSIDGLNVVTDGGMTIYVDQSIELADPKEYELILLPGGPIPSFLIENIPLKNFLRESNGLIAASCASCLILASAGLIKGDFTCMPHVKEEYPKLFMHGHFTDNDVCSYDRIITSKGFAHFEFMMAILMKLELTKKDPRLSKIAWKLGKNA